MSKQIHNMVLYKRAVSESNQIYNRFKNYHLEMNKIKKKSETSSGSREDFEFNIFFSIDNEFNLKFQLSENYPFQKPKLFVNNINYEDILIISDSKIIDFIKKEYRIECLCCSTVLCNWTPAVKLDAIIDEFLKNKNIIYNGFYKKKLFEINENSETKLPDELLDKISAYFH